MKAVLIGGGILGSVVGSLMMFIALEHDPQGSVSSDFGWLVVGLSWALVIWAVTLVLALTISFITRNRVS